MEHMVGMPMMSLCQIKVHAYIKQNVPYCQAARVSPTPRLPVWTYYMS